MKTKIKMLGLLFAVCLSISSCNRTIQAEGSDEETKLELEIITDKDGREILSDSRIENDIQTLEQMKNCYSSKFTFGTEYDCLEYQIYKRQTNVEQKNDTVYCTIIAQNNAYKVILDSVLYYNYYDVGGWILDDVSTEIQKVIPIAPLDFDYIKNLYEGYFVYSPINDMYYSNFDYDSYYSVKENYFDPATFINTSIIVFFHDNLCFEATVSYLFDSVCNEWKNYVPEEDSYHNNYLGMQLSFNRILDTHFDYDELVGTFVMTYYGQSTNDADFYLMIHELDLTTLTATVTKGVRHHYSEWSEYDNEETIILYLDPFNLFLEEHFTDVVNYPRTKFRINYINNNHGRGYETHNIVDTNEPDYYISRRDGIVFYGNIPNKHIQW